MSQWFHAEDNQQVGPISADEMTERFRAGRLSLDTLVWREGLPAWQPLRSVAGELDLLPAAVPPMPPMPPQLPPQPPAPAPVLPSLPPAGQAPLGTPKKGLSGGAIAALVIVGAVVVLVPVLAILAAIALPAYQQYTVRSRVAEAVSALQPLKAQVLTFAEENGRCPSNDDAGFPATDALQAQGISHLQLGRFNSGQCGIEATLSVRNATLDGDLLWLEYDAQTGSWTCSGQSDDRYLPAQCRG